VRRNDTGRLIEFFSKDMPFVNAFECLFESASDAIYILDARGNFVTINREAEELTGFKRKDWIGKSFRKIISTKSLPKATKGFLNVIRGKPIRVELELKTAFKKTVLVEVTSKPLIINGKIVGTLGIARDITERKNAEERIRESEERYRSLVELAPDSIMTFDLKGVITSCNTASARLSGYSKDELVGKHFSKAGVLRARDIPKYLKMLLFTLRGKVPKPFEAIYQHKNGTSRLGEVRLSLTREKGKIAGIQAIMRDVTERKKADEALRDAKEKWVSLMENTDDVIMILDGKDTIQYLNPTPLTTDPREAIGKSVYEYLPREQHDTTRKSLRKVFKTGKPDSYEVSPNIQGIGTTWFSTKVVPIKHDSETVSLILISTDITERKQMEKKLQEYSEHLGELVEKRTRQLKEAHGQLLKAERLAAIGEIAAMVGHDLRNPLTGIAGATYYLKTKLGSKMDKKSREMLELVEKSIGYSNKIISDLLDYSKEIRLELTETTPKSIAKDALTLVKIPKDIRILDLTQNKPKIKVDVPKMERVFVNIINNAIDAMPKGGTLTIASKESNGNLKIAFADTGAGMPKEVMDKIWTPLFTTKAKGMGLGLPICKRIVEAHGGDISVESTVSKGTTFLVTIPVKPKLEGGEKIWVNVPESLLSTTTKA